MQDLSTINILGVLYIRGLKRERESASGPEIKNHDDHSILARMLARKSDM